MLETADEPLCLAQVVFEVFSGCLIIAIKILLVVFADADTPCALMIQLYYPGIVLPMYQDIRRDRRCHGCGEALTGFGIQ